MRTALGGLAAKPEAVSPAEAPAGGDTKQAGELASAAAVGVEAVAGKPVTSVLSDGAAEPIGVTADAAATAAVSPLVLQQQTTPTVPTNTSFDLVKDFTRANNPGGAWSYGWKTSPSAAFTLLTNNDNLYNLPVGISSWYVPNGGANMPVMAHNSTGTPKTYLNTITQPADVLTLAPGPNGEKTVVRWTAPAAMTVQIEGRFEGLDSGGATSGVSVTQNSTTTLLNGSVNGYGTRVPFSLVRKVAAGDVIDFAVGYGGNNTNWGDATGLAVSISVPPLAAYWQFNEDAGAVAVDATGNGNTGTLQTPTRSVGRDGSGALNFNGAGDAVSVAAKETLTALTNTFTVSFWAYPRSTHEIDAENTTGVRRHGRAEIRRRAESA